MEEREEGEVEVGGFLMEEEEAVEAAHEGHLILVFAEASGEASGVL